MISVTYFGLLLLSLAVYWLMPWQRARNLILTLSSFAYLYLTDKWSVLVVGGLSVFSYVLGRAIAGRARKGLYHFIGVTGVLAILVVFKYLGFLTETLNSLMSLIEGFPKFNISALIMPLGISYIVFKHISYLTDIKWGLVKPGRFEDFLLYSSLFTIFVAGPIERFERLKPQLEQYRIAFAGSDLENGLRRIIIGLFKKLVIADWIAYYINPVWQSPGQYSALDQSVVLLGYAFQIYYDFSGYSDIAIGSSRLFGLKVMENFQDPYLASSISQFWRRWHISLSDWIRDYLFFPLSRLHAGKTWQIYIVPVTAMGLCGLWHGSEFHYLLWGLWHGIGLMVYQIWQKHKRNNKKMSKAAKSRLYQLLTVALCFLFVTLGWLLFSTSDFASFVAQLFSQSSASSRHLPKLGYLYIAFGALIVFCFNPLFKIMSKGLSPKTGFAFDLITMLIMLEFIMTVPCGSSSFVYAGF